MDKDAQSLAHSLKALIRASFIVLVAISLSKIFTYIYRIIIARYYGPEVYGLFALSLMVVGWFILLSRLGLTQGLSRFVPLYRGKKQAAQIRHLIKITSGVLVITSILSGIVLYLLADIIAVQIFSDPALGVFLKIFAFSIPFTSLTGIALSVMRSYERIAWFSFINQVLENGVKLLLLLFLMYVGFKDTAVPLSYAIGTGIVFFVAYVVASRIEKKEIHTHKSRTKKGVFRDMLSYSWPLIFFSVMVSIFHWTDTFIIGIFMETENVGFYNAAVPLALLITISVDLFRQLFFPIVTKEYGRGNKKIVAELSKQVGKWIFVIALPILLLMLVFPGFFLKLFFGEEYLIASNALRFLAIGALFTSVFDISKELLSMKGKSKTILADIAVFGVVNLTLNLLLVPRYGIVGAGISTMVSLILLNITFTVQSRKVTGIIPLKHKMWNVLFAGLISLVFLVLVRIYIEPTYVWAALLGIVYAGLYFGLLMLTKSLDKNDVVVIKSILKKAHRRKK